MSEAVIGAPQPANYRVLVTFIFMIVAFLVILALDLSLARIERIETATHAANLYAEGTTMLAGGRVDDAVDRFGAAVALERDSAAYAVALGEANLARGQARQAESIVLPRLEADPTDGTLNLAVARILVKEGRADDAISYYHRAIYGRWTADPTRNRDMARSELIDVLAKSQRRAELLAELLPMQDESSDAAFQKKLAHLFLVAGSPERAAEVFRAVLRTTPGDADAYAGLAQAAFARGNFRVARADLRRASKPGRGNPRVDSLTMLADTALFLDPEDARGDASDRYRRSLNFLHRTVASVMTCPGPRDLPALSVSADSANALDRAHVPLAALEAQNDANLALAARAWKLRPAACPLLTYGDRALALVHATMGER